MHIHQYFSVPWKMESNYAFVGNIYQKEVLCTDFPLKYDDLTHSIELFLSNIKNFNGFWGFAAWNTTTGYAWLASDKIRSFPIFYAVIEDSIYISNNAYWIAAKIGHLVTIDQRAEEELLMTEQVTGNDTLIKEIKQVQVGEVVFFIWSHYGKKWNIKSKRYFYYYWQNSIVKNQEYWLNLFDQVISSSFARLIQFAAGRALVIPLSGGYDSRLIVIMLKRMHYHNLITFSYGRYESEESILSQQIANTLHIRWFFVEYTDDLIRKYNNSKAMQDYKKLASNLCAVPHLQDYYAVKELKERRWIPDDSIFVPGHSADLLSGSISKKYSKLYRINNIDINKIINYCMDYLYTLSLPNREKIQECKRQIEKLIGTATKHINAASLFESIITNERQAKFIVNSVRVYEDNGYNWWLPYRDSAYVDFWSQVPMEYHYKQQLYLAYIKKLSIELRLFPGNELRRDGDKLSVKNILVKRIKRIFFVRRIARYLLYLVPSHVFINNNFYTAMLSPQEKSIIRDSKAIVPNGALAAVYINEVHRFLDKLKEQKVKHS